MRILLTGATGYIGKRLLPVLLEKGHKVICCVRDKRRLELPTSNASQVEVLEIDFLEELELTRLPTDFEVAYYLIHSMTSNIGEFSELEARTARQFVRFMNHSRVQQIIYLSGIVNEKELSAHLKSRLQVENILRKANAATTVLRAGIIVGSGSASFEIMRDLVEKLPVMVAPKWVKTRCQPIAIRDVISCLTGVLLREDTYHQHFDIGGPDVLTYREMMLQYSEVRKLRRWIFTVPVMTPRLSSYWLYFVTSTSYKLAVNLVDSMKIDVVAEDDRLMQMIGLQPITYKEAVSLAFDKIAQNLVVSSWKDALVSSADDRALFSHVKVPSFGCFKDKRQIAFPLDRIDRVEENIWSIGGQRGWYYGNMLWRIRGYLDKLAGGVGLRRGRTNEDTINPGDALDFWRVLVADREEQRLLLYAEMKLPGDAWLEFNIRQEDDHAVLHQTATFRPDGVLGRLYWYGVLPFHFFIFQGMIENIIKR